MPTYYLTVRFPLSFLGNNHPERLQDPQATHEREAHAFYNTDSEDVADQLLEQLRQDVYRPICCPNSPPLAFELWQKAERGEQLDSPIYGVVNGEGLSLQQRVSCRKSIEPIEELSGYWDVGGEAGTTLDLLLVLALPLYLAANDDEPKVRRELGISEQAKAPVPTALPLPITEIRCAPMSMSEIARRYLDREKAKPIQAEKFMQQQELRQEPGIRLFTIRIDNLSLDVQARFKLPLR